MRLDVVVKGSHGDLYSLVFEREGQRLRASCTCPAGQKATRCRHRLGLMRGDLTALLGNTNGMASKLASMVNGSDAEAALHALDTAEAEAAAPEQLAQLARELDLIIHLAPPRRRRRTENVDPVFVDRMAHGWAFGVVDAFRTQLDMRFEQRVDSEASKAKEQRLGRKLYSSEKVLRSIWTQGSPPAYSFARGHLFHSALSAHWLGRSDVPPSRRYSITVLDARPDPGALVEAEVTDDAGEVATKAQEAPTIDKESGLEGWVDFEVFRYEEGSRRTRAKSSRTQKGFVEILRNGLSEDAFEFEPIKEFSAD